MINVSSFDDLYMLYGFSKAEETSCALVYLYNEGYFNNAEIVILNDDQIQIDELSKSYINLGYSIHRKRYESIEDAHEHLFRGFFRIEQSSEKLVREYRKYCEAQTRRLGDIKGTGSYSYIEGYYYVDNERQDAGLVNTVCSDLLADGARLIILEAAAGFGKTCTSYEIVNQLANTETDIVPLFVELSRNRKATLFRYVLLSEIDSKFTGLSYNAVRYEIRNGRIPLIIDGFDELLSRSFDSGTTTQNDEFEEAQTMLDTIAQLLNGDSKAKILLSSRKSSIFTGDVFDEWIEKKIYGCNITRIQIAEPTVIQWIGKEKVSLLSANNIDISKISNPVLLSILRNTSIEEFQDSYKNTDDILNRYFHGLLFRERERQQLLLSDDEQYRIMTQLAAYMVQFDISSEEPAFIKQMLEDKLSNEISSYLLRYSKESIFDYEAVPENKDEFIMKLVHHALLDRISLKSNKIGFLNDFIFGLLICNAIVLEYIQIKEISWKYIDISITAFSVKEEKSRVLLFDKLIKRVRLLPEVQQILVDITLNHQLTRDYDNEIFDSLFFKADFEFGEHKFDSCMFSSCTFEGCTFRTSTFFSCQFLNCRFYNINVIKDTDQNQQLIFYACIGYEILSKMCANTCSSTDAIEIQNYEKVVLEQYWKPGYSNAELRRTYRTLFRGISNKDMQNVTEAIISLRRKGILYERNHCFELNVAMMEQIKQILGRI